MPDLDAITAIIETEVDAMGFALVRVYWYSQGGQDGNDPTLQVMAERPDTGQLVIEDCTALSHRLSDRFDALEESGKDPFEEPYRLEVSSPGIDRPLTRLSDFQNWKGYEAKLELSVPAGGRKKLRGDLDGIENEEILMTERKVGAVRFPFEDIENAKLVLTDKLIASSAPVSSDGVDAFETDDEINP